MNVQRPDNERPFAYADPRSLSRAWFDALYAHAESTPASADQQPRTVVPERSNIRASISDAPHARANASPAGAMPVAPAARSGAGGADALAAPAARRARQATDATRRPALSPSPRLEAICRATDGTALKLLLEPDAGRVRAVAICDPTVHERVAEALARARVTLAARGIRLHTQLLESR